jgi:hypothetical protein
VDGGRHYDITTFATDIQAEAKSSCRIPDYLAFSESKKEVSSTAARPCFERGGDWPVFLLEQGQRFVATMPWVNVKND